MDGINIPEKNNLQTGLSLFCGYSEYFICYNMDDELLQ
jgi:hypothetical protein